jgi:hypothetical protein
MECTAVKSAGKLQIRQSDTLLGKLIINTPSQSIRKVTKAYMVAFQLTHQVLHWAGPVGEKLLQWLFLWIVYTRYKDIVYGSRLIAFVVQICKRCKKSESDSPK